MSEKNLTAGFNRQDIADLPDLSHTFEATDHSSDYEPLETIVINLSPTLEVELLSPEEALKFDLQPVAYRGENGKSPKIGEDGYWKVWNNETEDWEDTGVYAKGGISDYDELANKPSINDVELKGNKTSQELGLENSISTIEIEALFQEE